ncbi:hypothetical protein P368_22780 [Comamonas thiooxydans]|nr:hypothetical protein P369_21350 [Comamonas thiooxydans]KGG95232.1 hypothetical protein P367_21990 [Comamonas thiooxydans]KGG96837.1 hypothetical protein P365_24875 [Comamonas thiooxydans]KGH06214.1 hypothetical protein P368_22780 [Comamonas thiooxydans]
MRVLLKRPDSRSQLGAKRIGIWSVYVAHQGMIRYFALLENLPELVEYKRSNFVVLLR